MGRVCGLGVTLGGAWVLARLDVELKNCACVMLHLELLSNGLPESQEGLRCLFHRSILNGVVILILNYILHIGSLCDLVRHLRPRHLLPCLPRLLCPLDHLLISEPVGDLSECSGRRGAGTPLPRDELLLHHLCQNL